MRHRVRSAVLCGAACVVPLLVPSAAPAAVPGGGDQLVASQGRFTAIRAGEVVTFAGDGTPLHRCPGAPALPDRAARWRPGAPDSAEILYDAGLPDDDSTVAAEEVLDDERGPEPPARPQIEAAIGVPRALAAGPAGVWAATSLGVLRVDAWGCRRVALPGRDLIAIAVGARAIVTASAHQLFRADGLDPERSDAWPFRPVAALPEPPRALALDADGATLIADSAGVLRLGDGGEVERVLTGSIDALAVCDSGVLALAADGVYLSSGRRFARTGGRPPARMLGCGDVPARRWLAGGSGLWISADGIRWTEQTSVRGATVTAAAGLPGRIWMITDRGLVPAAPEEAAVTETAAACCDERPLRAVPVAASWAWPTVTAALMVDRTSARRTVTGFLLLRFPFDRPPPPETGRAALALEWARRVAAENRP